MQAIKIIAPDIAKSVFQVHAVDADGQVVLRRQLKRCRVLAFFEKVGAMSDWHRGLRFIQPLVPPASGIGTRCDADAAGLCEALRRRYGQGRCSAHGPIY
jgi:transposase